MNDTTNGLLLMVLGVLLAILYFALPPQWLFICLLGRYSHILTLWVLYVPKKIIFPKFFYFILTLQVSLP